MPEVFEARMPNLQAFPVIGLAERHAAVCVLPLEVFTTSSRDLELVPITVPAFELYRNTPVACEAGESQGVLTGAAVQI